MASSPWSDRKANAEAGPRSESRADLNALQARLGYTFTQPALLIEALTHSSLRHEIQTGGSNGRGRKSANESDSVESPLGDNERLEFLGDAIIGMLVAESLFRRFTDLREGELTRLRAALVSRKHLGEVGKSLELGQCLRMGRSEERNGGRGKAVLLANCVEALTAAIYLDSSRLQTVSAFVERVVVEPQAKILYRELQANQAIGDYKSALQEFLQARGSGQPEYAVEAETGPDHRKRFLVEVRTAAAGEDGSQTLAHGSGSTKKKAEQEAARRAFIRLGGEAGAASAPATAAGEIS